MTSSVTSPIPCDRPSVPVAFFTWLSLAAFSVLLLSFLLPTSGFFGVELCAFHALTGLSCPGCGLTRGFCAISHGHFREAWQLNPFAYPFYVLAVALFLFPLVLRVYPKAEHLLETPAFRGMIILIFGGLGLFGSWRLLAQMVGW